MVTQYGMSPLGNINLTNSRELSPQTRSAIETEMRRMIDEGHERARALLESRRSELDLLAKALVDYEVLSLEEMQKILKGEKLTHKLKAGGVGGAGIGGMKLPEIVLPPDMVPTPPAAGSAAESERTPQEVKREGGWS